MHRLHGLFFFFLALGTLASQSGADPAGWPSLPGDGADSFKPAWKYRVDVLPGTAGHGSHIIKAIDDRGEVLVTDAVSFIEPHSFLWDGSRVRNIETPDGHGVYGSFLNRRGRVAGYFQAANREIHACLWECDQFVDLGTLGGKESWPTGLNDRGEIVGMSRDRNGSLRPFIWRDGVMEPIEGLSDARGINNRGVVVGFAGSPKVPVVWDRGVTTQISDEEGYPIDVNDRGEVIGYLTGELESSGVIKAFHWFDGRLTLLGNVDPGLPLLLNERGVVVGSEFIGPGSLSSFIWRRGIRSDMGIEGGYPLALNDKGVAVGGASGGPFVWSDGEIHFLETPVGYARVMRLP